MTYHEAQEIAEKMADQQGIYGITDLKNITKHSQIIRIAVNAVYVLY